MTFGDPDFSINSVRFDSKDNYVATACHNGCVRVYNIKKAKLSYIFQQVKEKPAAFEVKQAFSDIFSNSESQTPKLNYNPQSKLNKAQSSSAQKLIKNLVQSQIKQKQSPVTCLRWRPITSDPTQLKAKRVIMCVNADGSLSFWHMFS